jgi:hypothetical protein
LHGGRGKIDDVEEVYKSKGGMRKKDKKKRKKAKQ